MTTSFFGKISAMLILMLFKWPKIVTTGNSSVFSTSWASVRELFFTHIEDT